MNSSFSRRRFIRHNIAGCLAAASFPAIIPASALGQGSQTAPSNRIGVGCIGTGP